MNRVKAIQIVSHQTQPLLTVISNKVKKDKHFDTYILLNQAIGPVKRQQSCFEVLNDDNENLLYSYRTPFYHYIIVNMRDVLKESEVENVCKQIAQRWFDFLMNPFYNPLKCDSAKLLLNAFSTSLKQSLD